MNWLVSMPTCLPVQPIERRATSVVVASHPADLPKVALDAPGQQEGR